MQPEVEGGPFLRPTLAVLPMGAARLHGTSLAHPVSMMDYHEPTWEFAQPPPSLLVVSLVPLLSLARWMQTRDSSS